MKQPIEIFNEVRMAFVGQPLTSKAVKAALTELPGTKSDLFLTALVKNHCIERPEKGKYVFTSHPIHKDLLSKAYDYIRNKQNEYNRNYRSNKKPVSETKSEIQKAIDLLLATGEYEIYKIEKIVNIKKIQIV